MTKKSEPPKRLNVVKHFDPFADERVTKEIKLNKGYKESMVIDLPALSI